MIFCIIATESYLNKENSMILYSRNIQSMIGWAMLLLPCLTCAQDAPTPVPPKITFLAPKDQGMVKNPSINEASGIVASRKNDGVLWTHNDSGNSAKVYAISSTGETLGEWTIAGAQNRDWEDIAIGPGPVEGETYLYVGDIGDNQALRPSLKIYRFPEPTLSGDGLISSTIEEVETITLRYPDGARDAETLLVDPLTRDIYIVSKRDAFARIYRLAYPQTTGEAVTAEKLGEWPREIGGMFNQPVGGDISPDGKELLIKSYVQVFYWRRENDQTSIFDLMQTDPETLPYTVEPQGEAIGWAPDMSGYFTLSEEQNKVTPHLFFYERKEE